MNPYTREFYNQIGSAKKAEEWACEILQDRFGVLKPCALKESGGDLVDSMGQMIEVKYDKGSKRTKNVALEISAYGKLKGLSVSKSKYYFIICMGVDYYVGKWIGCLINTNILRALSNTLQSVMGGDNDATEMKLIPVTFLIENSEKIYPLSYNKDS